jgi:superfamily II DNA helicase RecQ
VLKQKDDGRTCRKKLKKAGVNAKAYHAGLDTPVRSQTKTTSLMTIAKWFAPIAFGMGNRQIKCSMGYSL